MGQTDGWIALFQNAPLGRGIVNLTRGRYLRWQFSGGDVRMGVQCPVAASVGVLLAGWCRSKAASTCCDAVVRPSIHPSTQCSPRRRRRRIESVLWAHLLSARPDSIMTLLPMTTTTTTTRVQSYLSISPTQPRRHTPVLRAQRTPTVDTAISRNHLCYVKRR